MTMTHEVAQTERPDHAGVAFHPPFLLAAALALGVVATRLTPLAWLPDAVARPAGPLAVAMSFGWFL